MSESDFIAKKDSNEAGRALAVSFEPGEIIGGKYKVVSLLGQGGMGCVYRVEQVFLKQAAALKTINSGTSSENLVRRFQNEARAASMLNHPCLVRVSDFGMLSEMQPYLVMDYVDGETLAERIKSKGTLSLEEASVIFAQVCMGLAYAHDQGIVHRDIKPSNIMLPANVSFGAEGCAKVVDFGIAKLTAAESGTGQTLTATGEIFGSPLYMSPEQCTGSAVDYRSDVYSLGCVLFEALTGTPPYVGKNALMTMMQHQSEQAPSLKEASLGKDFPPALEQLVRRMLAKDPCERYQNLGLVANELALISKGTPISIKMTVNKKITGKEKLTTLKLRDLCLLAFSTISLSLVTSGFVGYHLGVDQRNHAENPARNVASTNLKSHAPAPNKEENMWKEMPPDLQGEGNDNLAKELKRPEQRSFDNDSRKLNTETYALQVNDHASAKKIHDQLVSLASRLQKDRDLDQNSLSSLKCAIGYTAYLLNSKTESEISLSEAERAAHDERDFIALGTAYAKIGAMALNSRDYKDAYNWMLKGAQYNERASHICSQSSKTRQYLLTAGNLYRTCAGIKFNMQHDYESAVKNAVLARQILRKAEAQNEEIYSNTVMVMGAALSRLGRFEDARPVIAETIEAYKLIKSPENDQWLSMADCYSEMALVESAAKHKQAALECCDKCRRLLLKFKPKTAAERKILRDKLNNLDEEQRQVQLELAND